MKHLGRNLDNITFIYVILGCIHTGLVDEGRKYFNSMSDFYYIILGINNYTCIIDLIGGACYLEEAFNFIINMPIIPELYVWMCLFGAYRSYKNVGIVEFMEIILFLLEPQNA